MCFVSACVCVRNEYIPICASSFVIQTPLSFSFFHGTQNVIETQIHTTNIFPLNLNELSTATTNSCNHQNKKIPINLWNTMMSWSISLNKFREHSLNFESQLKISLKLLTLNLKGNICMNPVKFSLIRFSLTNILSLGHWWFSMLFPCMSDLT